MVPNMNNPYRIRPPTPARTPGVDMESASLLDEEAKATRARVIAHLMLPVPVGGGLTLNRLVFNLRERVESSCEKIYRDGKPAPETISANYVHIHSWMGYKVDIFQELPKGTMSPEDTHLSNLLHRYKHDATSRGSPISPEYEQYYKSRKESEANFQRKAMLVNCYIDEFDKIHKLSDSGKRDLAELVLNVWQTVAVNSTNTDRSNGTGTGNEYMKGTVSPVAAQMEAGAWFYERYGRKPPMTSRRRPSNHVGSTSTWSFDVLSGVGNRRVHFADIDDLEGGNLP